MVKINKIFSSALIGLGIFVYSPQISNAEIYFENGSFKFNITEIQTPLILNEVKAKPKFFFKRPENYSKKPENYSLEYIVGASKGLGEIVQNECGYSRFDEIASLNNLEEPYNLPNGLKIKLPKNCKSPFKNYISKAVKINLDDSQKLDEKEEPKILGKSVEIKRMKGLETQIYTVKLGDSLSKIALKIGHISWQNLYNQNIGVIGDNPGIIKEGIKLKISKYTDNIRENKSSNPKKEKLSYLEKTLIFLNSNDEFSNLFTGDHSQNYEVLSHLSGSKFKKLEKILSGSSGLNKLWAARRIASLGGISQGKSASGNDALENVISNKENIERAANKYRVNDSNFKELITSISLIECGAKSRCISNANSYGANGLSSWTFGGGMQSNGEIWDAVNPFNAEQSFDRSAQMLNLLLKKYTFKTTGNSNQSLAILAYHQGESKVNLALDILKANGEKPTYKNVLDLQIEFEKKTVAQLKEERIIAQKSGDKNKIRLATKNLRLGKRNLQKGNNYTNIPCFRGVSKISEFAKSQKFIFSEGQRYVSAISRKKRDAKKIFS